MVESMLNERLILGDACVAEGAAWLAAHDPRFADALEITGPFAPAFARGGISSTALCHRVPTTECFGRRRNLGTGGKGRCDNARGHSELQ